MCCNLYIPKADYLALVNKLGLLDGEQWKICKRLGSLAYYISNQGRFCFSVCFKGDSGSKVVIEFPAYKMNHKGRIYTYLLNKRVYIDNLVAEYFVDNPNNLKRVRHLNGNLKDNRACNLIYTNPGGIKLVEDADLIELPIAHYRKPVAVFTLANDKLADCLGTCASATIAAQIYGCPRCSVSKVLKGEYNKVWSKTLKQDITFRAFDLLADKEPDYTPYRVY